MTTRVGGILRKILATVCVLLAVALFVLWRRPPDILRVGTRYTAKIVCSNVFLAHRDADEVMEIDIGSPGVWILRLMQAKVDRAHRRVNASLWGFIAPGVAVYREGYGCTALPDARLEASLPPLPPPPVIPHPDPDIPWPEGDQVHAYPELERLLQDKLLVGPGIRSVIVVDHGRIVGERYGRFAGRDMPLLGWSMTKTVLAALVGRRVQEGKLTLDTPAGFPAGDPRHDIRIADLLDMSSGLAFNEAYGAVSDVTRMLYLEPDMAAFARAQPLAYPVGSHWSYSSGGANILARIVQDSAGSVGAAYPAKALFAPLGMSSAVIETDPHGTLVASSYMYATPRDWARFGQFLLQDGLWQGQRLLPEGFVDMMATPVAASGGQYGHGLTWRWAMDTVKPGENPDLAYGIPPDTFWLSGHDGQSMAIIRSRQLVILRMGLTPSRYNYVPEPLVKAILQATQPRETLH